MRIFDLPFLVSRPKASASVYLSETAVALACTADNSSLDASIYHTADTAGSKMDSKAHILFRADPLEATGQTESANLTAVLKKQVAELGVHGARVTLVLAPDYYSLNLMERPEVAADEVNDAVRWRLQDILDYPVDQAVIDTFAMPSAATTGRNEMVFAVSMKRAPLQKLVDTVLAAGLTPERIDITEMALRNITQMLYPEHGSAIGLLRMTPRSGLVNITQNHSLFLSRRLTGTSTELQQRKWEDYRESILLQVQRSMDYYESTLSQSQPALVLVTATQSWERQIVEYFKEMLPINVESLHEVLCQRLNITAFNPEPVYLKSHNPGLRECRALAAALPALGALAQEVELSRVVL